MTYAKEKECMAYAIGIATVTSGVPVDREWVDLGKVCENWKGYSITGFGGSSDLNHHYFLWYDGPFGEETTYTRHKLLSIDSGWELNHLVHILTDAIKCHKAEVKAKEKKEKQEKKP